MKKVLVVADTFFPNVDGVTRFIKDVIPGLSKSFDITILAPGYKKIKSYEGMPVVTFPIFKGLRIKAGKDYYPPIPLIFRIRKHVKNSDVVFAQSLPFLGIASILMAKLYRKPTVMYFHHIGWDQLHHLTKGPELFRRALRAFALFLMRFFSNRCDLILIPSEQVKHTLNTYGFKSNKAIVQLGINTKEFKPIENKDLAKKRIGIDSNSFVIGYCGRISKEKDLTTLVQAFKELNKKYDNLYLLLVGAGDDIQQELKGMKNARITGFMENVVPYYQAMDVCVLPSLTETTGLALPEAMSCGIPVITTPVGFALTSISNGYNGLIFSQKDVPGLVEQLDKVYNDKALRASLTKNGRKTVEDVFTWEKTIAEIKDILNKM
ncbi:hypothetical protein A3K72_03160 [Candidatus Woesearchaeota archaeon RBG_13_36_6]|nr:MAG: hypothetical protein A3K72_03160 [Candidatus Woesearchaeota archaeon RBG_13_36_6]